MKTKKTAPAKGSVAGPNSGKGFERVKALSGSIKAIKQGSITPRGLAPGQEAPTPQKVKPNTVAGVPHANGGKIRPQRG